MAETDRPKLAVNKLMGRMHPGVRIAIGLIATIPVTIGIAAFVLALHSMGKKDWDSVVGATMVAVVFGSFGFALAGAMVAEWLRDKSQPLLNAPPDEPWLAKADWSSRKIHESGASNQFLPVWAAVPLWWNFASLPLLAALPTLLKQQWGWLVLLVPAVGVLLIAALIYKFFRARKFGDAMFEMASVPGVIGGQLAGVVRIPRRMHAPDGFRLRLTCVEWLRIVEPKPKRRDHVIWQDERLITDPIVEGNETGVPVSFAIPFDLPETSWTKADRDFEWRLEVLAGLPGIDYGATFEVPVYKTAESRHDVRPGERPPAEYAARPGIELVLRDAGIARESVGVDGVRLTFPAARNWRVALVFLLFPLAFAAFACLYLPFIEEAQDFFNLRRVWTDLAQGPVFIAIVKALFHTVVAIFFCGMFSLIALVFTWISLDLWLYRSVVEATPAGLTFRGGWLGLGRARHFAPDDVRRFKAEESMRSSGGGLWKSVVLIPRRGRGEKLEIGKAIRSKLAQEAVINELTKALGLTESPAGIGQAVPDVD